MNKTSIEAAHLVAGCGDPGFAKKVIRFEWWLGFLHGVVVTLLVTLVVRLFEYA